MTENEKSAVERSKTKITPVMIRNFKRQKLQQQQQQNILERNTHFFSSFGATKCHQKCMSALRENLALRNS